MSKVLVSCLNCGNEFLKDNCQLKFYPRSLCSVACRIAATRFNGAIAKQPKSKGAAAGHCWAWRHFPPAPCQKCGAEGQRHHCDGNPANNDPSNIMMLCPKHHCEIDGRANRLRRQARSAAQASILDACRDERGQFIRREKV